MEANQTEDGEETEVREFVIRYDPEGYTHAEMEELAAAADAGETGKYPERSVIATQDEDAFDKISEASMGVAEAFLGHELFVGTDLIACPSCEYEGMVSEAVFPGGTAHQADDSDEE